MSDKPQWLAVAMEEIERQYAAWDKGCLDTIEAIILKHCPEDKAVGKLVEACQDVKLRMANYIHFSKPPDKYFLREMYKIIQDALSEYEDGDTRSVCQRDKAVRGLVEALQEITLLHDNVPVCYPADGKTERLTVSRLAWVVIYKTAKAALAEYQERCNEGLRYEKASDDKGVGKLVEAANKVVSVALTGGLTIESIGNWQNAVIELETALAEYEANK